MLDFDFINKVKKISLISLFSDDKLMQKLVLKGGNAINMIYNLSERPSIDLDFSIENDFNKNEIEIIKEIIKKKLEETFNEEGFIIFDYIFKKEPPISKYKYWGGYRIEFKIIEKSKYNLNNLNKSRLNSKIMGYKNKKNLKLK